MKRSERRLRRRKNGNNKNRWHKILDSLKFTDKKKRIILISTISFVSIFLIIMIADATVNNNKIHYGVKISGIDLGLKRKSEAKKIISSELEKILKQDLVLEQEEKVWRLDPQDINTQVNIDKSIDKAFKIGREGSIINRITDRLVSWITPKKVSLISSINNQKLRDFVTDICNNLDKEPVDARVVIEDTKAWMEAGKVGIKVERPKLYAEIRKNIIIRDKPKIIIPIKIISNKVTEEDAKNALIDVKKIVSAEVGLKYDVQRWVMTPQDLSKLITFKFIRYVDKKNDKNVKKYRAILDREKLDKYLKEKANNIYIPAINADFKINGTKVYVENSQNGREVDSSEAYPKLNKAVLSEPPREVILTTRIVEPELTTEEAKAMEIKELVASYSTSYNAGNIPRVKNIKLLSEKLNGTIVAPGEIFSFNEVLGQRTVEAGFVEAPAIVSGDYLPAIGGGVCQVATTLFNAVFFGGYEITERHNHSLYISHYPQGRDAGVSYPSPDLKFRNDTSAHLLVKSWASNSNIAINIYSKDLNTDVSYSTTSFSNIQPYSVKRVNDPTLEIGKEKLESNGVEGKDITVYRTVKRGNKIVHKDTFFSRYLPKPEIINKGTKELPKQPPDQATKEALKPSVPATSKPSS